MPSVLFLMFIATNCFAVYEIDAKFGFEVGFAVLVAMNTLAVIAFYLAEINEKLRKRT